MIAFDHLVIYSSDPKRHQEIFSSSHKQIGVPGGQHEEWGTFNHLAFFKNNAYIEWLGIQDEKKVQTSDNPLIQQTSYAKSNGQEGPIQFALRVDDIDSYIQHFDKNGIDYKGPFPGKRTRIDGSVLEWKMLFPVYEFDQEPLPFLIEWSGEGNTPIDEADINASEFNNVTIFSQAPERFVNQLKDIYQLEDPKKEGTSYQWPLKNGKFFVKPGRGIEATFKFNLIKFRSMN